MRNIFTGQDTEVEPFCDSPCGLTDSEKLTLLAEGLDWFRDRTSANSSENCLKEASEDLLCTLGDHAAILASRSLREYSNRYCV